MYRNAFRKRPRREKGTEEVTRETIRAELIQANLPKPNPYAQPFEPTTFDLGRFGPGYWARQA